MATPKSVDPKAITAPKTIDEALEFLEKSISSQENSLKEAKDQRKILKKQKASRLKKNKLSVSNETQESHSECQDEETAYYAALAVVYGYSLNLNDSITFAQAVYNGWQDCLNS